MNFLPPDSVRGRAVGAVSARAAGGWPNPNAPWARRIFRFLRAGCACWLLFSPVGHAAEPSEDERLQVALRYLQAGKFVEAEQTAQQAIASNPRSARSWTLLGLAQEQSGRLDQAAASFEKALGFDANLKLAHTRLGVVRFRAGDRKRAAASFTAALQLDATDPVARLHLGQILLEDGDAQAALEHLRVARQAAGDDPRLLLLIAQCQRKLGNDPDAVRTLSTLRTSDRQDAEGLFHAGSMLLELDEPGLARTYLARAAKLSPNHPAILVTLAAAELQTGAAQEAAATIDRVLTALRSAALPARLSGPLIEQARQVYLRAHPNLKPSFETRFLLAELHFLAKDYASAVGVLESIDDAPSDDPDYFNLLGMSRAGLNDFQAAGKALGEALRIAPERPDLLFNLATVYQKAGDNDNAIRWFEQALKGKPDASHAYFGRGVSWFNLERYGEAAADFRKALEIEPRQQEARIFLARAQAALGENDKARQTYREALSTNPACEECRYRLALSLLEIDALSEAAGQLRELVRLNPRHSDAHYQLGKLQALLDAPEDAVKSLEKAIELDPGLEAAYYQLGRLYAKLDEPEKAKRLLAALARSKKERLDAYQEKVSATAAVQSESGKP